MLFPTNPDLADIFGDTDFDLILFLLIFFDPIFPDSGFPDYWILESGSWQWLAAARGGAPVAGSWRFLDGTSGTQNLGDPRNRENPISASPVREFLFTYQASPPFVTANQPGVLGHRSCGMKGAAHATFALI